MFVFRNTTVERFFERGTAFSGYNDISLIPQADTYVWFYLLPMGVDTKQLADEIRSMQNALSMVSSRLPDNSEFLLLTMAPLYDCRIVLSDNSVRAAVGEYNAYIEKLCEGKTSYRCVRFDDFLTQYPRSEWVDFKYSFTTDTLLNPKLATDFKVWWQRQREAMALKRKKCLVLDCDNTLWDGVLGEDGMEGIQIGEDYPGSAFRFWQNVLLLLKQNGIILTVCSKNNESDVVTAFSQHPTMPLRMTDFVAYRINWQNKDENIRAIAEELNIGLDSMVFVDDSPVERELVKQSLPMVSVPDFPSQPYDIPRFVNALVDNYFRVYAITEEDKRKTEQYRANACRKAVEQQCLNYEEYLQRLEMKLHIGRASLFEIPRMAQMTQKTNQFNLTTKRYTESDIRSMYDRAGEYRLFWLSVRDKFGDNGITGELIARCVSPTVAQIDTLLLSCRILGRRIEFAFVATVLNCLYEAGIEQVRADYVPTSKNMQVADFYDKMGFRLVEEDAQGNKHYVQDMSAPIKVEPYYDMKLTV